MHFAARCAAELRKPLAMRPATDENSSEGLQQLKQYTVDFERVNVPAIYLTKTPSPVLILLAFLQGRLNQGTIMNAPSAIQP